MDLSSLPRRIAEWDPAEEGSASGRIVVHAPRGRILAACARFLGRERTVRLRLDEVGSHVWRSIDGRRDVDGIIREVRMRFGPEDEGLDSRVTVYLRRLVRDRLITFEEQS